MIKILFVCHGNICRSPMAEFVMRDMAQKAGADVYTASAATSTEEIGNPVHRGTRTKTAFQALHAIFVRYYLYFYVSVSVLFPTVLP